MKKLLQKIVIVFVAGLILVSGIFAQQNYKIRQTMSMNGQKSETTTYVRGSRKRTEGGGFMGMGGDVATVEQCDLKRNLKISDKKKMYAIEPFDNSEAEVSNSSDTNVKAKYSPTEKGGVVTYISNINDTGERKQMFGLTARHIKTSMTMESSPDACTKQNMKIETDAWYVDLPEFSCPMTHPQVPQMPSGRAGGGGCRDQIRFKNTGSGKIGFPLTQTITMNMGDEGMSFTQSIETLEFSKATLDSALFDIPQGYALTANSQDLYGKPDMSAMMRGMGNMGDDDDKPKNNSTNNNSGSMMNNSTPGAKKAGTIRIGVYAPTNKNGENISTTNMQMFLVQKLTDGNVEAVSVNSESDARAANCDYVLTSDFSKLKLSTAGKIGGMFGKITNTDTSAARSYDTQVDFKLSPLGTGKTIQNKSADKSQNDADKAAETVLSMEAQQILSQISR